MKLLYSLMISLGIGVSCTWAKVNYISDSSDSIPEIPESKPLPSGLRLYIHTGFYVPELHCINAWYRYYGYPQAPLVAGSGGGGMFFYWGKGWQSGLDISFIQSGKQNAGGYSLEYMGSGAGIWWAKRVFALKKINFSPVLGLEARNLYMRSERSLPSGITLDGLLGDPSSTLPSGTGSTLHTHARNIMGGIQAEKSLGKRIHWSFRCWYASGSRGRWELNNLTLPDSPRTGIRGWRYDFIIGLNI